MRTFFISELPPPPRAPQWRDSKPGRHARLLTMPTGALERFLEPAIRLYSVADRWKTEAELSFSGLLFAGDHAIVQSAPVSAYPQEVTGQMVSNFLSGGACQNVLSSRNAQSLTVVNVGVADQVLSQKNDHCMTSAHKSHVYFRNRHIPSLLKKQGSRQNSRSAADESAAGQDPNFSAGCCDPRHQASLGAAACRAAFEAGRSCAAEIIARERPAALVLGEMGIGNTTASAALAEMILCAEPATLVGRGTGVDSPAWEMKRQVVRDIHKRLRDTVSSTSGPENTGGIPYALAEVGGFEHAAIAGAAYEAAIQQTHVLLDGLIVTSAVAAMCAGEHAPTLASWLIAGHCGAEPAHGALLNRLGLLPLLSLDMRLGEGSGAMIAAGLIIDAGHVLRRMATFTSAGVSTHSDQPVRV